MRRDASPAPGVSLVIPTYNRCWYIEKSLASLRRTATPRSQYEVLVIDDGSSDQTELAVDSFQDLLPVRYLRIRDGGPSRNCSVARNRGIIEARFSVVATTDPEILFPDDVVTLIRERFRTYRAFYLTAGSFAKLDRTTTLRWMADGEPYPAEAYDSLQMQGSGRFAALMGALTPGRKEPGDWRQLYDHFDGFPQRVHPHDPHALLAARKRDLVAVGGYDERFCIWGSEDTDLLRRLETGRGLRRRYDPAVRGIHLWHPEDTALMAAGEQSAIDRARSAKVFLAQRQRVAAYRGRNARALHSPLIHSGPPPEVEPMNDEEGITCRLYRACLGQGLEDDLGERRIELFGGHCAVAERLAWGGGEAAAIQTYRYVLSFPWERCAKEGSRAIERAWEVSTRQVAHWLARQRQVYYRYPLAAHAAFSLATLEGGRGKGADGLRLLDTVPRDIERPYRISWKRAGLVAGQGDVEQAERLLQDARAQADGWTLDRYHIDLELANLLLGTGRPKEARRLALSCRTTLGKIDAGRFDGQTLESLAIPLARTLLAVREPREAWRILRESAARSGRRLDTITLALEAGSAVADGEGVATLLAEASPRFAEANSRALHFQAAERMAPEGRVGFFVRLEAVSREKERSFIREWVKLNAGTGSPASFADTFKQVSPETVVRSLRLAVGGVSLIDRLYTEPSVARAAHDPGHLPLLLLYAETLFRNQKPTEAVALLIRPEGRATVEKSGTFAQAVQYASLLARGERRAEAAAILLGSSVRRAAGKVSHAQAAVSYARQLQAADEPGRAVAYLRSGRVRRLALEAEPPVACAYAIMALETLGCRYARSFLKNYAMRHGESSLRTPDWARFRYQYAVEAERQGKQAEAWRMRRSLAEMPLTEATGDYVVSALYHLGVGYLERGDTKEALRHLSRALALRPDHRLARAWIEKLGKRT